MKIGYISDVHLEFIKDECFVPETNDADALIFAGDISSHPEQAKAWMEKVSQGKPSVYVPGNHEFYGYVYQEQLDKLRELYYGSNITLLHQDKVNIGGVDFLGAILWTDFDYFYCQAVSKKEAILLNDFRQICHPDCHSTLTPDLMINWHLEQRNWLAIQLDAATNPTVIVTHHAPTAKSVAPEYAYDRLTPAFVSRLDHLMDNPLLKLWVHGHMHTPVDVNVGHVQVVCNPIGYPHESRGQSIAVHTAYVD
ncbi:metallophosphoesterase [Photobacterium sagamiensis]|uniref:metallophosphoesterase n=1 Tax=Photobacterium sagamiensis TaxID=2910241 RepID=UPI003D11E186